ncbi:asparagine synthase-related protein [Actinoplanes siamensis]|uniref:asparagine synthase-related protein n=1 Tax=Actinoplanes siamensis TaxID=1223317 RepID=UPI001EF1ACF2
MVRGDPGRRDLRVRAEGDPGPPRLPGGPGRRRAARHPRARDVPRHAGGQARAHGAGVPRRADRAGLLAARGARAHRLARADDQLGMASGLDVRIPFADPRLVDYTFNIPWSMKSFDGREKSLLRAAMKDLLPEKAAYRIKLPYPNLRDRAYDEDMVSNSRSDLHRAAGTSRPSPRHPTCPS